MTHTALDSLHDVSKLVFWWAASNSGHCFPKINPKKRKYSLYFVGALNTVIITCHSWKQCHSCCPTETFWWFSEGLWKRPGRRNPEEETEDQKEKQHFLRAAAGYKCVGRRRSGCKTVTLHLFLTHTLQLLLVLRTLATVFVLSDGCEGSVLIGQGDFIRRGDPQKNSRSSDSVSAIFS